MPARIQPQTFDDVERGLIDWLPKIQNVTQWSDDNRPNEFEQLVDSTKQIVAKSNLTDFELKVIRKRRNDELLHKATSCKRIRSAYSEASGLTKEGAERVIAEKKEKEEREERRKEHNNYMRIWRIERNAIHIKGVAARKDERVRQKQVKELDRQGVIIPIDKLTPIEDPEAEWKNTKSIWKMEEARNEAARKKKGQTADETDEDRDEIEFITDTIGDDSLRVIEDDSIREQTHFIAFDENNENYEGDEGDEDENDEGDEGDEDEQFNFYQGGYRQTRSYY